MSENRRVVSFHYTLRNPEGRILDTSQGGDPIVFLEQAGMIIDGLDDALQQLPAGTKSTIEVPSAKGYGAHDPSQVQPVPRDRIPVEGDLKIGDQFQTGSDAGAPVVTVVGIEEDKVILDANHPMAGLDLTFEVEVLQERPATAEELTEGKPLPVTD